jgi:hypothetical protein
MVRATLMCAAIALPALSSIPANAELPRHHKVVTLGPTPSDHASDAESGFPIFSGFGTSVAIRNGIAFVGIPHGSPTSRVAVYEQTAGGLVRTTTLTVRDALLDGKSGFGRAIVFRDGLAVIASHTFLHVFRRIDGVWTDVQKLAPPQGGPRATWEISAMRFENGILVIGSSSSERQSVVYLYELAANGKFVRRANLRASDSFAIDHFGSDVAVAGNVVVVGEPLHDVAYVFRRRSDGTWVEAQKLRGTDISSVGSFGAAVAIDRGMIIVGAPDHECLEGTTNAREFCDPSGGGTGAPAGRGAGGAAYGFVPVAGQYVQVFKLRPGADEHFDYFAFGRRIAMMGNHVVIDAAEQSTDGGGDLAMPNGLSFTYKRDGSTVAAPARGVTSGYVASDSMGLANNWLLVGSGHDPDPRCQTEMELCFGAGNVFDLNRFEEIPIIRPTQTILHSPTAPGVTHLKVPQVTTDGVTAMVTSASERIVDVYRREQSGAWSALARLPVPGVVPSFTASDINVALEGRLAVITERAHVSGAQAYVYRVIDGTWRHVQTLSDPSSTPVFFSAFGAQLAIDGDVIAITDEVALNERGAVYIYMPSSDGTFALSQTIPGHFESERMGDDVAIGGKALLVGASNANTAYVFEQVGEQWVQRQKLVPERDETRFGSRVALSAEVMAVSAQSRESIQGGRQGSLYVYAPRGPLWERQQILDGPEGHRDFFAGTIDVDGSKLLALAFYFGAEFEPWINRILLYERTGGSWKPTALLIGNEGGPASQWGAVIAAGRGTVFTTTQLETSPPNGAPPVLGRTYILRLP